MKRGGVYPRYAKQRGPRGGRKQNAWVLKVPDPSNPTRYHETSLPFPQFDRAAAEAEHAKLLAQAMNDQLGRTLPADRTTVAEYAKKFFALRTGLRESSELTDQRVYDLHIAGSSVASLPLSALKPPVLRTWYRAMRMKKRVRGAWQVQAASLHVQNHADKVLTKIVRQAAIDGLFGREAQEQGDAWRKPWHGTKPGTPDLVGRPTIPGGVEGMGAFLATCEDVGGLRLVAACAIAMITGTRRGELRALRWNETLFLLDGGEMALAREDAHRAVSVRVVIPSRAAKNHKLRVRTVPVPDVARKVAAWWQRDTAGASSPWVFAADDVLRVRGRVVGEPGRLLQDAIDEGHWRAVKERAGLDASFRVHDLRGTYAKHLEDSGTPTTTIQELLDHGSLATTERYLRQLNPELRAQKYVADAFGSLTIPSAPPAPAPYREVAAAGVVAPPAPKAEPSLVTTRAHVKGVPRTATGRGLSAGPAATPYGQRVRDARNRSGLSADALGAALVAYFAEHAPGTALAAYAPRGWGQRIYKLEAGQSAFPEHERRAIGEALAHVLGDDALRFVPAKTKKAKTS